MSSSHLSLVCHFGRSRFTLLLFVVLSVTSSSMFMRMCVFVVSSLCLRRVWLAGWLAGWLGLAGWGWLAGAGWGWLGLAGLAVRLSVCPSDCLTHCLASVGPSD